MNIWCLRSNFVYCKSFLESNSPDILVLCETNLEDSVDSSNFTVRVYLLLIQKDSFTRMHGLPVYVKEGLPFAQDISLENSGDSYLYSTGFTPLSVLLFFLYRSPSSSLCTVFDSILSNIDEVLSTHLLMFLSLETLRFVYSGGTDRPGELCYNFLSQMTLPRWSTFLLGF